MYIIVTIWQYDNDYNNMSLLYTILFTILYTVYNTDYNNINNIDYNTRMDIVILLYCHIVTIQ